MRRQARPSDRSSVGSPDYSAPDHRLTTLTGHNGDIFDVAFSPDDGRLATTSVGVTRVWATDLDDLITIAEGRLTRSPTDDESRQYLHVENCPQ